MENAPREVFAENLRAYMEKNGKKQIDIAVITGVTPATVSDWVHGKKYPRIDKIEIIAEYLHCEKSDLIESKDTFEQNQSIADAALRMQDDPAFREAVELMGSLQPDEMSAIVTMIRTMQKISGTGTTPLASSHGAAGDGVEGSRARKGYFASIA